MKVNFGKLNSLDNNIDKVKEYLIGNKDWEIVGVSRFKWSGGVMSFINIDDKIEIRWDEFGNKISKDFLYGERKIKKFLNI